MSGAHSAAEYTCARNGCSAPALSSDPGEARAIDGGDGSGIGEDVFLSAHDGSVATAAATDRTASVAGRSSAGSGTASGRSSDDGAGSDDGSCGCTPPAADNAAASDARANAQGSCSQRSKSGSGPGSQSGVSKSGAQRPGPPSLLDLRRYLTRSIKERTAEVAATPPSTPMPVQVAMAPPNTVLRRRGCKGYARGGSVPVALQSWFVLCRLSILGLHSGSRLEARERAAAAALRKLKMPRRPHSADGGRPANHTWRRHASYARPVGVLSSLRPRLARPVEALRQLRALESLSAQCSSIAICHEKRPRLGATLLDDELVPESPSSVLATQTSQDIAYYRGGVFRVQPGFRGRSFDISADENSLLASPVPEFKRRSDSGPWHAEDDGAEESPEIRSRAELSGGGMESTGDEAEPLARLDITLSGSADMPLRVTATRLSTMEQARLTAAFCQSVPDVTTSGSDAASSDDADEHGEQDVTGSSAPAICHDTAIAGKHLDEPAVPCADVNLSAQRPECCDSSLGGTPERARMREERHLEPCNELQRRPGETSKASIVEASQQPSTTHSEIVAKHSVSVGTDADGAKSGAAVMTPAAANDASTLSRCTRIDAANTADIGPSTQSADAPRPAERSDEASARASARPGMVDAATSMDGSGDPAEVATPDVAEATDPAPDDCPLPRDQGLLRGAEKGVLLYDKSQLVQSPDALAAAQQAARMRVSGMLLKTLSRHALMRPGVFRAMAISDEAAADVLYAAAVLLLALAVCSRDLGSVCLAFYDGARALARALRAPRAANDWGVRVCLLGVATCFARVDRNAPDELLKHGVLAAVEHCLHVAMEERDFVSVHLSLDLLDAFASSSSDALTQSLACPLLETLVALVLLIEEQLRADDSYSRHPLHPTTAPSPSASGPLEDSNDEEESCDIAEQSDPITEPPCGPLSVHVPRPAVASTAAHKTVSTTGRGDVAAGAEEKQTQGRVVTRVRAGDELDLGAGAKAAALVATFAGASPAHKDALLQLDAVDALMALLQTTARAAVCCDPACFADDEARSKGQEAGGDAETGGAAWQAGLGAVLEATLWALVRLVDDCPAAQRSFVVGEHSAGLAGFISFLLSHPDLQSDAAASSADVQTLVAHRVAELQAAYATHRRMQTIAAVAVATPRAPLVPTQSMGELLALAGVSPRACSNGRAGLSNDASADPSCPSSCSRTPAGPETPRSPDTVRAEATMQMLGIRFPKPRTPGDDASGKDQGIGDPAVGDYAGDGERGRLPPHALRTLLSMVSRLVVTLTEKHSRGKEALREAAVPVLLMHALRGLPSDDESSEAAACDASGRSGQTAPCAPSTLSRRGPNLAPKASSLSFPCVLVGATIAAAAWFPPSKRPAETFRRLQVLRKVLATLLNEHNRRHSSGQWFMLRRWIVQWLVAMPDDDFPVPRYVEDGPFQQHQPQQQLRAGSRSLSGPLIRRAGSLQAQGRRHSVVPQMHPRKETAAALLSLGFHLEDNTSITLLDSTLPRFVQMLRGGLDSQEALSAADLIRQLALLHSNLAEAALAEGALWALLQVLAEGDARVHSRCARRSSSASLTRGDWTPPPNSHVTGFASAAADVAASSATAGALLTPAEVRTLHAALSACCALMRDAETGSRLALLSMGGIEIGMSLLSGLVDVSSSLVPVLTRYIAAATRDCADAQAAAVKAGVLVHLNRKLHDTVNVVDAAAADLQQGCCDAVAAIVSGNRTGQAALLNTTLLGALERLIPRMVIGSWSSQREQLRVTAAAARAIAAAVHGCPSAAALLATEHAGGIKALVRAQALPANEAAAPAVLRALTALCGESIPARRAMREHGGIDLLAKHLADAHANASQDGTAFTVVVTETLTAAVRHDVVNGVVATERGVFAPLVRMLGTGRDSVLSLAASRCIGALVTNNHAAREAAVAAGVIEALTFLLGGGATTLVCAAACRALASLLDSKHASAAPSAGPYSRVVRCGTIEMLVALLDPCDECAAAAASALACLVREAPAVTVATAAKAPLALVTLLQRGVALVATSAHSRCVPASARALAAFVNGSANAAQLFSAADGVAAVEAATVMLRDMHAAADAAHRCAVKTSSKRAAQSAASPRRDRPQALSSAAPTPLEPASALVGMLENATDQSLPTDTKMLARLNLTPSAQSSAASRGAAQSNQEPIHLEEFDPLHMPELLAGGVREVSLLIQAACRASPVLQAELRPTAIVPSLVPLLSVADADTVEAVAAALAALATGDTRAKHAIIASKGMLALSEVLFRGTSVEAGVLEAAPVMRAIVAASDPAAMQAATIASPNALSPAHQTASALLATITDTLSLSGSPGRKTERQSRSVEAMAAQNEALRAHVAAAEVQAFREVSDSIATVDSATLSMKRAAAWALFQLALGSVESRRALVSLSEHTDYLMTQVVGATGGGGGNSRRAKSQHRRSSGSSGKLSEPGTPVADVFNAFASSVGRSVTRLMNSSGKRRG